MAGYFFFPENHAPHLDSQETQADLSQGLEGSGDQEGELALTEEEIQSKEAQVEASSYQNDFEEEKAVKLDPSALDNNLQCPRTEDTVEIVGSPGCKTCRYILVRTPQAFTYAQVSIRGYCGRRISGRIREWIQTSVPYSFRLVVLNVYVHQALLKFALIIKSQVMMVFLVGDST